MFKNKIPLAWIIQDQETKELETVFSDTVQKLKYRVQLWEKATGKKYRIVKRAIPLRAITKSNINNLLTERA